MDFRKEVEGSGIRILLCEDDPRILQAAVQLKHEGNITPVLIGNAKVLHNHAKREGIDLGDIEIHDINPEEFVDAYRSMERHKNVSEQQAKLFLSHPASYACMLVQQGKADGLVCGATWPTKETLTAAIHTLRDGLASSYFFMETSKGTYLFGDCGFIIQPDAQQLAQIAYNTGCAAEAMGIQPKIAMLSFSTVGSAKHPDQEKVAQATWELGKRVAEEKKNWTIGGEYQADAALRTEVAKLKAPENPLQGDANILIFPDLDAGNIGYKLVAHFADAQAIGPILHGFKKPVNDLSRGAKTQEIVDLCYVTAWQTKHH